MYVFCSRRCRRFSFGRFIYVLFEPRIYAHVVQSGLKSVAQLTIHYPPKRLSFTCTLGHD